MFSSKYKAGFGREMGCYNLVFPVEILQTKNTGYRGL